MTNMEYYREQIKAIADKCENLAMTLDGSVTMCSKLHCNVCMFFGHGGVCCSQRLHWLMAEHKEEPTLTKKEYYLTQLLPVGWVARDSDSILYWYDTKPKKISDFWDNGKGDCEELTWLSPVLEFIHWDDTEPWSVEELRKLKVKQDEPKED